MTVRIEMTNEEAVRAPAGFAAVDGITYRSRVVNRHARKNQEGRQMTDTPIVRRGSITQQEWEARRARYKQAIEAHPGVNSTFAAMLENAKRFEAQNDHDTQTNTEGGQ